MTGAISHPKRRIESCAITNAGKIFRRKTKSTCAKNGTAGSVCLRTGATGWNSATMTSGGNAVAAATAIRSLHFWHSATVPYRGIARARVSSYPIGNVDGPLSRRYSVRHRRQFLIPRSDFLFIYWQQSHQGAACWSPNRSACHKRLSGSSKRQKEKVRRRNSSMAEIRERRERRNYEDHRVACLAGIRNGGGGRMSLGSPSTQWFRPLRSPLESIRQSVAESLRFSAERLRGFPPTARLHGVITRTVVPENLSFVFLSDRQL